MTDDIAAKMRKERKKEETRDLLLFVSFVPFCG
jgi:hypothetical protein